MQGKTTDNERRVLSARDDLSGVTLTTRVDSRPKPIDTLVVWLPEEPRRIA